MINGAETEAISNFRDYSSRFRYKFPVKMLRSRLVSDINCPKVRTVVVNTLLSKRKRSEPGQKVT